MCSQFDRKFKKIFENHAWQQFLKEFKYEYSMVPFGADNIYEEIPADEKASTEKCDFYFCKLKRFKNNLNFCLE
jgi:hypothetical protein